MTAFYRDHIFKTMIPDHRWSAIEDSTPNECPGRSGKARSLAELAWYELAHLKDGQCCRLSGEYSATFYKVNEGKTIVCVLDDGYSDAYTHDSDEKWESRRDRIAKLVAQAP